MSTTLLRQIPYGRQSITEADVEAVTKVLGEDFLTQGPHVAEFENAFAKYVGASYAVAVSNGTAALHLAALALGVGPQSKVITTPITFAASGNCVLYCGGQIDFVDVDQGTALIDLEKVKDRLEASPKGTYDGIIPVDFTGHPVHTESLRSLADEHGLWILEDACHAPGGHFTDTQGVIQKCGNGVFAELSIFSFHPVKHIASGEGGMITTNDLDLYEKLLMLRTHGITKDPKRLTREEGGWYHEMQMLGYNYRITDFQCALGHSQLLRADEGLRRRKQIAKIYDEAFEGENLQKMIVEERVSHAYHLYVIKVEHRRNVYDQLRAAGILAQVHYIPMHLHPYYQELGWKKGDLPFAEEYYSKCISLPMFPTLTDDEVDYVISTVKRVVNNA